MPNLTTTIEDTSPVIIYSNGWWTGTSTDDPSVEKYSDSSYMKTNVSQASVSFSFYGNGVQLFGAKRQNYSRYHITIDTKVYPSSDASSSDSLGVFQTSLFSTIALPVGYHTVQMTNEAQETLDLDFITWQTPVGSNDDNGEITAVTSQDSDPSFEYIPPSEWTSDNVPGSGTFSGGSGHLTATAGASVKFTFEVNLFFLRLIDFTDSLPGTGSAVQLFGPVGPNCAPYSVSLDGGSPVNYSPNKPFYRPQQLLFQASHLASGQHSMTVQSQSGTNSTVYFAIDYAQVFSTSSSNGSGGAGLSAGQIVGIVVGVVCGLLLLGALVFLFVTKRWKLFRKEGDLRSEIIEPFGGPQTPGATSPLSYASQNLKNQQSHGSIVQDQRLTSTTFSGENLYSPSDVTPFPWSSSTGSPTRGPRILDEKRRPPSDAVGGSSPEMTQSSVPNPTPIITASSTEKVSPPDYLK